MSSLPKAVTLQHHGQESNSRPLSRQPNALNHYTTDRFTEPPWVGWYQKEKTFWILLKQEMTEWQWHHLDHMQVICTSLQTDNHANTLSLKFFLQAGCSSCLLYTSDAADE